MKVLFIFLTCLIWHQSSGQTFEGNGYKDVVVAISPDVSPDRQQEVVDNLKRWISTGSKSLYIATKQYAYISSVTILLPTSWTEVPADPSSGISYDDGVIRVDKPNPQHGDGPYTEQTGTTCGDRGKFIHVTPDFITNLETTSTQYFGPTDKLFVNQWAQLRYGVFDEHGYPGDPQFPLFYYEQTYVDGELETKLTENFCTDSPLFGHRMDFVDGGSCQLDPVTNLPNGNCVFVPDGDNSKIRSSLMALTSPENLDQFCNDTETSFAHNPYRPNKQNKFCDHKSTWSVIIANQDFVGVTPMDAETPPETTFKIVRPEEERFVFVLDVSGSMAEFDRIGRLIQSSNRWVKYEVREGSQVGVTSFSSNVNIIQQLTVISSDAVRDEITRKIDTLKAKGGTCLGAGLKNGMNVLNGVGDTSSGGVILFVTDGVQDCDGPDKDTITNPTLLQRVKDTKVRIITIAFGTRTDENLQNLAVVSGGKVYFVPDGTGIEDINNAFDGSLTFQPAVPSGEVDIVVFSERFKDVGATQSGTFIIDGSLGRDAKFQMDFIAGAPTDIQKVDIHFPNSSIASFPFDSSFKTPFLAKFDFLEVGNYVFDVVPSPGKTIPYLNVVISAKAASGETLPFFTNCWLSAGNTEVDLSTTKLSILAEVKQGNRAVFNAKVQAFVESGDEPQPITLDLFDNGSGSDLIANDGIYSRFFVKYDGKNGDYTLRCQVKGDENTNFVAQNQEEYFDKMQSLAMRSSRAYPAQFGPTSPICCGSNGDSPFLKKEPTGNFERKVTGTSFKLKNVPSSDIYPPIKVADFKAEVSQIGINISFTAPGDDFDEGTANQYDVRYSTKFNDLLNDSLWIGLPQITVNDVISGSLSPLPAGNFVSFEVSRDLFAAEDVFYLAMRALDENSLSSPTSSPFQLVVDIYPPDRVDNFKAELKLANVAISFTAPGDDSGNGTASYYDIRFTSNEADFSDENLWNDLRDISAQDVTSGNMNPVKAGTPVKFEVSIDLFAPDDIIFLAMRSCDNLNQTSAISEPVKLILDTTPPDDVTDLVATLLGSNVEITFTAPGDDSDKGIASFYDLRYTTNLTEFSDDSFWEDIRKISEADLVSGNFDPVESGKNVTFEVSRNLFNESNIYYLSVRSYDSVNNRSPISDPIELDLGSGAAATGSLIGLLFGALMILRRF